MHKWINKIYIDILNDKQIFLNLKQIEISTSNLQIFIDSNIICPNIEELKLYIDNNFYYEKKVFEIFQNIISLKLHFHYFCNLTDIIKYIINLKIKNLEIYDLYNYNFRYKINKSKIILSNITTLIIYSNIQVFIQIFDNLQFTNLQNFQIIINSIKRKNFYINYDFVNEYYLKVTNDCDLINLFLLQTLNEEKIFSLNDFINFPEKLNTIQYLKINLNLYSFIYEGIKRKNNFFEFKVYDEFKIYYLNYDLSLNGKEISKFNDINIEGLFNKIKNLELIENTNINLCDINFNINKLYIKSFTKIRSIYCEAEIQNTNFISIIKEIINQNGFNKLKYINLTIGYINKSSKNNNLSNEYFYLSKLIKSSKNLKSLILRLDSKNYIQDISFFLSLIEDLKKLRILNIIPYGEYMYDLNEEKLLNQYPKLKQRLYYFDEFIINKKNNFDCVFDINKDKINQKIRLFNYVKQYYRNILNEKKEDEMTKYFEIYLNEKKIEFCFENKFQKKGKYKITIKCIKLLTSMANIFSNCSSLTSLNISNFKTDNLKNMNGMFYNCTSLTSLDLSNFKTDNVVDMEWMFSECSSLTTLNLSKFNTKNVTNMNRMFYKCCSLTSLNLSNFNTYNVTVMSYMFSDCSSLINLDLSKFNTNKVTVMSYMFFNCRSLINLELSNFNADNVDDMSYMFCNCSSLKTLDLTNFTIINYPFTYKTFYGVNKNCQLLSYDKKILSRFSDFVCQKKNNNVWNFALIK